MNKELIVAHKGGVNNYPPMGALYLADYLEKSGAHVELIRNNSDLEDIVEKAKKSDRVNMSVITSPEIERFAEISKRIIKDVPSVPVVWGGVHPTLNKEQVESEDYVDQVYSGKLKDKTLSPKWDLVEPISQFIFPAEHSVKMHGDKRDTFYYLMTSDGCKYSCSFCSQGNSMGNKGWNGKSVDWVKAQVEEISDRINLSGRKLEGIGLWDDYFWGNKNRAEEILNHLASKDIGYLIEARANNLVGDNGGLMKMLKDTGCMQVFVGAESFDQETLKYINKKTRASDYEKLMAMAKGIKLPTRLSLIVGFPYESEKSVNLTLDRAIEIPEENPYVSISGPKLFTPYPGTKEYERAIERGLNVPKNTEAWANIHRNTDNYIDRFPWIKENLSPKTIKRLDKELRK